MKRTLAQVYLFCSYIALASIFWTTVAFAGPKLPTAPSAMRDLPPSVVEWWFYETHYVSDKADLRYIPVIGENNQDPRYRPEARRVFDLTGYWLPLDTVEHFRSTIPEDLQKLTLRTNATTGKKEILFFIHPESMDLYPEIIQDRSIVTETFKAIPSASSRGLLVWKPGHEKFPFIAKVSLNREISNSLRVIPAIETQVSIEASKILLKTPMTEKVSYMHEVLSAIPKGMDAGGAIYRVFPNDMLEGRSTAAPLFALYGGSEKVPDGTLLKTLIDKSGMHPLDFAREQIIRPFAKAWLEFALKGISMEPHAQNVLVSLNAGKINGLIFRDFGGFDFDREFRKKNNLPVPEESKNVNFRDPGDFTVKHSEYIFKSLQRYFSAGFLYGLEEQLFEWKKNKTYPLKNITSRWAKEMLAEELSLELSKLMNKKIKVSADFKNIATKISEARETAIRSRAHSCSKIY